MIVHPADIPDRDGAPDLLAGACDNVDSTVDVVHGDQQLSLFNAHY
jgi:hypothetical protein